MNKALTERFLASAPIEHRQGYRGILISDPNRRFEETGMYFYSEFGQEDEIEINENKDQMKKNWHPKDGFQVLK